MLGDVKSLLKMLQSCSLELARAVDVVGALTDTLEDYKSGAHFSELWKDIQGLVAHRKITTKTLIKTRSKAICRFLDSLIMSSVRQRYSDHQTDKDFNRAVFFSGI